jgi:hypothetical protein
MKEPAARSAWPACMLVLASVASTSACHRTPAATVAASAAPALQSQLVEQTVKDGVLVNPNRRRVSVPAGPGRTAVTSLTDWSGKVQSAMWICLNHTPQAHVTIQCAVDPGWVLVGGGAWADASGGGGPGALLTASYPFDPNELTTWEASSKDHVQSSPHILSVFAIGLKLSGYSRDQLRNAIYVNQQSGGPAPHPDASAALNNDSTVMLDLGGGSRVDWHGAGNLLTFLMGGTGISKDHLFADPATITSYRILMSPFVSFGELELGLESDNVNTTSGVLQAHVTLPSGVVPVGLMAASIYNGPGRMLSRLSPASALDMTHFVAESRDHLAADGGTLIFAVNTLRLKP